MSVRLVPPVEYALLVEKLVDYLPMVHLVYPIIKFEVDGLNAGTTLQLYEYTANERIFNAPKFYLACKYHQHTMTIIVGNSTVFDNDFETEAMKALFSTLWERIESEETVELIMPDAADIEFRQQLNLRKIDRPVRLHTPAVMFYMAPDSVEKLHTIVNTVPTEFCLKPLLPEHAEVLISLLLHGVNGDAEQAALRIRELPSIGIFEAETDKLIAFEYNDGLGMIAHQYVYPEYRGRGFGKTVENIICQNNAQTLGIWPTKAVAKLRPKVLKITEKNPLWTKLCHADGTPYLMQWSILTREVQPPINFYDN